MTKIAAVHSAPLPRQRHEHRLIFRDVRRFATKVRGHGTETRIPDVREVDEGVEKTASCPSAAPSSDVHQNTASVKDSLSDPVATRSEKPHGERPKRKTRSLPARLQCPITGMVSRRVRGAGAAPPLTPPLRKFAFVPYNHLYGFKDTVRLLQLRSHGTEVARALPGLRGVEHVRRGDAG